MSRLRRRLSLEWSMLLREISLLRELPEKWNKVGLADPDANQRSLAEKTNGEIGGELAEKLNASGELQKGVNRTALAEKPDGLSGGGLARTLEQLHDPSSPVRAAAAKAIGQTTQTTHSEVAEALVPLLVDEDLAVRWAAIGSLIRYGCAAVEPLLLALTRDFRSMNLRQGVHHVLKPLYENGDLNKFETDVFQALEHARPALLVARLANEAIIAEFRTNHPDQNHS